MVLFQRLAGEFDFGDLLQNLLDQRILGAELTGQFDLAALVYRQALTQLAVILEDFRRHRGRG